jgi:hypothetical protein
VFESVITTLRTCALSHIATNGLDPLVAGSDARAPEAARESGETSDAIDADGGWSRNNALVRAGQLLHEGPFRRTACLLRQARMLRF